MIYTVVAATIAALTVGVVYVGLWGLLMEHIRISMELREDSRYELTSGYWSEED